MHIIFPSKECSTIDIRSLDVKHVYFFNDYTADSIDVYCEQLKLDFIAVS